MKVLCVENSTLLVRKRHSVGIPSEESFIISVVDVAANKEVTGPMVHIPISTKRTMNSNNIKHKKTKTYDGENLGPGLGQEGGVVKPQNYFNIDGCY
jgi:hypothetical protein